MFSPLANDRHADRIMIRQSIRTEKRLIDIWTSLWMIVWVCSSAGMLHGGIIGVWSNGLADLRLI